MAILVDTWWYWVIISLYCLVLGDTWQYINLSWVMQLFVRASGISYCWGSKKQIYTPLFVQAERGPWIFIREAFVIQMFRKSLWPRETRAEQNWNMFNKFRLLLETPSIVSTIPLKRDNLLPLGKNLSRSFLLSPWSLKYFFVIHYIFLFMIWIFQNLLSWEKSYKSAKQARHKTKI